MKLSQFSNLKNADWVFTNTFQAMMPSGVAYLDCRIEGHKCYGASPWKPLSEECLKWLETKPTRSVIYVSFGRGVWCPCPRARVPQVPPRLLPELWKEKGLIVASCNQLEVLANGCFVMHCGWNSRLEGLSLGVPMAAVPQCADQLTDAKFFAEVWEVRVRPKEDEKGVVMREELVASLKEVMEGKRSQEIKRNASFWRDKAKEAVGEVGSSDKCIDEFVWYE